MSYYEEPEEYDEYDNDFSSRGRVLREARQDLLVEPEPSSIRNQPPQRRRLLRAQRCLASAGTMEPLAEAEEEEEVGDESDEEEGEEEDDAPTGGPYMSGGLSAGDAPQMFVDQPGAYPQWFSQRHGAEVEVQDAPNPVQTRTQHLQASNRQLLYTDETLEREPYQAVQREFGYRTNIAQQGIDAKTYIGHLNPSLDNHMVARQAHLDGVEQRDFAYRREHGQQLNDAQTHPEMARFEHTEEVEEVEEEGEEEGETSSGEDDSSEEDDPSEENESSDDEEEDEEEDEEYDSDDADEDVEAVRHGFRSQTI